MDSSKRIGKNGGVINTGIRTGIGEKANGGNLKEEVTRSQAEDTKEEDLAAPEIMKDAVGPRTKRTAAGLRTKRDMAGLREDNG